MVSSAQFATLLPRVAGSPHSADIVGPAFQLLNDARMDQNVSAVPPPRYPHRYVIVVTALGKPQLVSAHGRRRSCVFMFDARSLERVGLVSIASEL